jgi:hypothetical protein
MQLASHGSREDEETQLVPHCDHEEVPDLQEIVSQSNTAGSSTEYLVSCEIKPVIVEDDNHNINANEETHLVVQDFPQCRICLDNEGPQYTMTLITLFLDNALRAFILLFLY